MSDGLADDRAAALATLVAVARRLAARDYLTPPRAEPLLEALVTTAATVMDAQAASVALHDPVSDHLVFVAAAGPAGAEVVGLTIATGVGIAGYAFSTGQPLAVADVSQDPRFDRTVAESTGYVPRSLLATPLIDEEGTIGVLEVLDRRSGSFDLRDLELAAAFAREATVIARHGRTGRAAADLLRSALRAVMGADATPDDVEALVAATTETLAADGDDPIWSLADRLARLIATDPERIGLAVDWADALIRADRAGRSDRIGRAG